jgi:hypothetical protein
MNIATRHFSEKPNNYSKSHKADMNASDMTPAVALGTLFGMIS